MKGVLIRLDKKIFGYFIILTMQLVCVYRPSGSHKLKDALLLGAVARKARGDLTISTGTLYAKKIKAKMNPISSNLVCGLLN